jgi:hypothetical protein
MDYEFWNFIVNCCVAIGTIGTVVTAIYLSMPKKEKAEGYFEIESFSLDNNQIVFNFRIVNLGKTHIKIDYKAGAIIKLEDKSEYLYLNNCYVDFYNNSFIPKNAERYFQFYSDLRKNNQVKQIYGDKKSSLCLYSSNGTEIELKKKK